MNNETENLERRLVEQLQQVANNFNGSEGQWSMGQPPYWHSTVELNGKKYAIQFGEEEEL